MSHSIPQRLGPYRITELLAKGGMGAIYRAQHLQGYTVALKVLPPAYASDPEMIERFRKEANAIRQLRHPNIVRVYEAGQADGMAYIAMEYIDGGSLAELMRTGRPLDPVLVNKWVMQVASALDHAHRQGIIHRDIKPGNVLLQKKDNRARLADFGIARSVDSRLTAPGRILGTPAYMSPEQAQSQPVDGRSDIYSLGVLAYEMLAGRVPFAGETMAVLHAHVHESPPPIRRFNPHLSRDTERVLDRALAKRADRRYATAGLFAQAFAASLTKQQHGKPIPRPRAQRERKSPKTISTPASLGHWLLYGALGLVILLIGLWASGSLGRDHGSPTATPPATIPTSSSPTPAMVVTEAPTPTWPTPTGDLALTRAIDTNGDGRIDSAAEIWFLRLPSRRLFALTSLGSYSDAPSWSPDGSQLAFASNQDGDLEIYIMAADGQDLRPLTSNPQLDSGPAWSPLSEIPALIAFDSKRDGDSEIYVVEEQLGQTTRLTFDPASAGDPAWSPDGKWIAYNSNRDGDYEIFVMEADGGNPRPLTNNNVDDISPAWSPDGRSIAFSHGILNQRLDIFLMNADGSGQRSLTSGPTEDRWPSWSPDSQWIVFSRQRPGGRNIWDLYVINISNQREVLLLGDGAAYTNAAWRP